MEIYGESIYHTFSILFVAVFALFLTNLIFININDSCRSRSPYSSSRRRREGDRGGEKRDDREGGRNGERRERRNGDGRRRGEEEEWVEKEVRITERVTVARGY